MKSKILPWAIVACLGVLLILLLARDSRVAPTIIETQHTDTLYRTRVDTLVVEKPVVKEKKVVEEKIIYVHDTVKVVIPISEYRFFEDGLYDITARGYDVSLSNVTVFPKTEYRTVTNTVETTVTKYRSSLFVFGGFSSICGDFSPKVGVSLSLKGKWLISGGISLYQKQPMYDATIGYNILHK